jgi:hypothetical protein
MRLTRAAEEPLKSRTVAKVFELCASVSGATLLPLCWSSCASQAIGMRREMNDAVLSRSLPAPGRAGPAGVSGAATSTPRGGNPPPCAAKFTGPHDGVQKIALAAKAGRDKNASRKEMCKLIETFAMPEDKVKYTVKQCCGVWNSGGGG